MPIDVPDVDKFGSTADRKIKVWSTPRFLACVDLIAKIDLPPDAAWRLLTHEGNAKAFRSIKRTGKRQYRKNNFFEREYDVDHITGWSVLWFSGEFRTRLRVTERKRSGSVHFKLLTSDVMDDFDGEWTVKPCTQQALDKMYGKDTFNPFGGLQSLFGSARHDRACLLEFTQQVQPKSVPKPLRGLARRIAASALKTTMEDIDIEARNIRAGKPTLPGFEQYADKALPGKTAAPAVACVALCNFGAATRASPGNDGSMAPCSRRHGHSQASSCPDQPLHGQKRESLPQTSHVFGLWHLAAWQPWRQTSMRVVV